MATACIFPVEIITRILCHTDPRDILQWRTVSRWFRAITYDAVLWKMLYANAPFPRPPGPSPHQSIASLERSLVRSAQLAQSWTTRPMRDVSVVKIELDGEPTGSPRFICGRWVVSCEWERLFALYDSRMHARQVLWEQRHPMVSSWNVCWMASGTGQCVAYVLFGFYSGVSSLPVWKLLEVRLNDESGELRGFAELDAPPSSRLENGKAQFHCGTSPFLFIQAKPKCLVFDTRTRMFYELPVFRFGRRETLWKTEMLRELDFNGRPVLYDVVSTDTHLISLWHFSHTSPDSAIIVQVYMLPPDGSSGNRVLRLTHEGTADFRLLNVVALKHPFDPATGVTNVTLLDYSTLRHDLEVARIDLSLPDPSADQVLPMSVIIQRIGPPKDRALLSRFSTCLQYVDVSDDGQVRGFFRGTPRFHRPTRAQNEHIMKFAIDTTHDPWVVTSGQLLPVEWNHVNTGIDEEIMFDGTRGKLCYTDPHDDAIVIIADIE